MPKDKRVRRQEPPADPTPETETTPHGGSLNRGGNWGNQYGAGTHRKSFRAKAAKAADEGLDFWISVAKGNKVIPSFDSLGKETGTRKPTLKERREAYSEILLRFGIGTQDEVIVLGNDETYRAVAIAMKAEGHGKEAIASVLVRLREAFGETT